MFLHLSVSHSVHRGVPASVGGLVPGGPAPCACSWGGGVVSQHTLQVSRPNPKGEVYGDLARGGSPGPHPRGEVEGDLVQARIQGGS